jgi:hypothetical protein
MLGLDIKINFIIRFKGYDYIKEFTVRIHGGQL